MKPEERLKLLKKTLKKSTALTEKLLQRLDREWDDIYQEDSENDEESSKASNNSSRRNSDAYDSDGSVRSLESIEKVLQRRNKMRTRINYDEDDETSDSDSDDDGQSRWDKNSKKRKKFLRNGGDKRPRVVDYKDLSSTDGSEYEPSLAMKYQMGERVKKERKKKRSEDESDYDIPE